ncbi:MAG: ABC transporter substrate-binding protein [Chloroflexota bacterium]|nr:ABC transporter substrate-binding protein [Chloroflexota bacterium]
MNSRRFMRPAAVLALAAIVCLPHAEHGPTTVHASAASINIAVIGPLTGSYAALGTAQLEGGRAAEAAINAAGGILGRPLNLVSADTVGDPADAVPALNKVLNIDHVVALNGPQNVDLFGLIPIIDRDHIPTMDQGGSAILDHNKDKYIWRPSPSDSQEGVAMALYALSKGYKTAALMFSTEESAQTLKLPVMREFVKKGGHIVADVNISPDQSSYRSEALRVVNAHPQVIFSQVESKTAGPLFASFQELNNLAIPFIGSDLTAGSDVLQAVTPAVAHRSLTSVEGSNALGGGGATFLQYYARLYKHQPLSGANYGYDATIALALAIDKAHSTNGDAIVAALPQVSNPPGTAVTTYAAGLQALKAGKKINYEGAGGPMDFDKYHNVYGPFQAVQATADGKSFRVVATISAAALKAATNG